MYHESYTCSRCGKPVSKGAIRCPHCGVYFSGTRQVNRPTPAASSTKGSKGCIPPLIVGIVVVILVIIGGLLTRKDGEKAKEAVDETVLVPVTGRGIEPETPTPMETLKAGEGFYERALTGAFSGLTVSVLGQGNPSDENDPLALTLKAFSAETGIQVSMDLVGYDYLEYENRLQIARQAGDMPDLIVISDFALLAELAAKGALLDVRDVLGEETLLERYDPVWLDLMTMEAPQGEVIAGIWFDYYPGEIVYYARDNFEAAGYAPPETWQEMIDLSDQIVSAGGTPWCLGIENDVRFEWISTAWLTDILLRIQPLNVYEALAAGELAYESPEIQQALEYLSSIWFQEGYVYRDPNPPDSWWDNMPIFLVSEPPLCWMFMDTSYLGNQFYMGDYGVNFDWFLLPEIDAAYGTTGDIWGDVIAVSSNRPEVAALLDYFTRPESAKWILQADYRISPHKNASLEDYPNLFMRSLAERYPDQAALVLRTSVLADEGDEEQFLQLLTAYIDSGVTAALGPPPAVRTGNLNDLLEEGSISVKATGSGIDELDLDIENLIDDLLKVEIPAGTYFVSGSSGEQNMVVRRTRVIEIDPGELVSAILDAACAEMEDDVPADDTGFSVQRSGSDALSLLMPVLDEEDVEYEVAQAAVWIVTNNADYSDLGTLVGGWGYARIILEDEAAQAMRLVDEAGLNITQYRIWDDREMIAAGASANLAAWIRAR